MLVNISFVHWLVILSILISIGGSSKYIFNTLAGKTKPNRVSWFMWALGALVSTAAALSLHADPWVTSRVFIAGFIPLVIFAISFVNKKSYWKLTFFDFLCGIFSLIALIAWLVAKSPEVAILLGALGDGLASLPTIIKAWKHPETETGLLYIASFISTLLILPAIPIWNIANAGFQIYLLAVNTALMLAVYRKRLLPKKEKMR